VKEQGFEGTEFWKINSRFLDRGSERMLNVSEYKDIRV